MGRLIILILLLTVSVGALAQTCTISTSGNVNWDNGTCLACDEGGGVTTCTATTIIVPSDLNLTFNDNTDTWAGTMLEVYGYVAIGANIVIESSITIFNGGLLRVLNAAKLDIGSASDDPCPYSITVSTGGKLDLGGTNPSERLRICNVTIAVPAGGSCNPFPAGPLPYCEPSPYFTGPIVLTEKGLPIELLYFNVSIPKNENHALMEWATEEELDFDHFEIQRAGKDLEFSTILELPGAGYNTNSIKKYTAYDENPLVGTGYYRLKAVDIDGSVEYFKIKSVNYNGNRKLLVSPNPVSGTSIKYTLNFDPGPYDRVTLINQVGTELISTTVTAIENELVLDSKLRPGAYLLRYSSPTFQYVARVFIKD